MIRLVRTSVLAYLLCGICVSRSSAAETLAFPGAEGAAANATGGRFGTVYRVTNLNASGPGSFADAVSQSNRFVVFAVSGIIDLASSKAGKEKGGKLVIAEPNVTVAGQTAPGEGICLKGGALQISAGNVIVRYIRVRRGWVRDEDTGDAIEVKPVSMGERAEAQGLTSEKFDKVKIKKAERGKFIHEFAPMSHIFIDHCSTSWATDENLTVTHSDMSTLSWSIAAEGLDYTNPKQTPPNHSEGSLWGSSASAGRSTMHHVLYAHNRLRNPRTTGGADEPATLTLYNTVIYDWSEYASHTGSERVLLNWVNNYYKPGLDTPAEIRTEAFGFHGDPDARVYAHGNYIAGAPEATANNKLAVMHNQKFKKLTEAEREQMKVDAPFGALPENLQTAEAAYAAVLAEAGATLPARDAVDFRITEQVRSGTGRIIQKETDLPPAERWPDYRSLPAPADADADGIPDYWEKQFDLNPTDAGDAMKISASGYANLEHYCNNTDPTGGTQPIVFVSASISRAKSGQQNGEWRFRRTGDLTQPLTVRYAVSGEAKSGGDFTPLSGSLVIPAGKDAATLALAPLAGARDNQTVVLTLNAAAGYHLGCPAQSLIVIRK